MFSWRINTTHWINKPFIIVISLLSAFFLQSFHTAGRKSMTPFTAATMSSKSAASLVRNGRLFPMNVVMFIRRRPHRLFACRGSLCLLCALIRMFLIFPVWTTTTTTTRISFKTLHMFLHPPSPLAGVLSVKLHPLQRCHFSGWMFSTPGQRELFLDPQEESGGAGVGGGGGGGGSHLSLQNDTWLCSPPDPPAHGPRLRPRKYHERSLQTVEKTQK